MTKISISLMNNLARVSTWLPSDLKGQYNIQRGTYAKYLYIDNYTGNTQEFDFVEFTQINEIILNCCIKYDFTLRFHQNKSLLFYSTHVYDYFNLVVLIQNVN